MSHMNNSNGNRKQHRTGGAGCVTAHNPGRDVNQCLAEIHARKVREISERGIRVGDVLQTRVSTEGNKLPMGVYQCFGTLYVTARPNHGMSYFFVAQVDTGHFQSREPGVVLVHDRYRPEFSGENDIPRGLKIFLKDREVIRVLLAFPELGSPGKYEVMVRIRVVSMTETAAQCVVLDMSMPDDDNMVGPDTVLVNGKVMMLDPRHKPIQFAEFVPELDVVLEAREQHP